jgi:hypothetical protein
MARDTKTPCANIPVVGRQTERMQQARRSWPETHWRRPTYCPDWTAADAPAAFASWVSADAQRLTLFDGAGGSAGQIAKRRPGATG